MKENKKGKVYLIGAGPGDAGLLTVRGAEIIQSAETAVYDRLVGKDILKLIPETAELINVGKNAGNHPVPQHEINKILLEKALEGKTVVRIKGGDSFVFGRGGEELELLEQNGIEFEVVPGITSSLSAPAYAGIPVTHRDYCSSVHIITGHSKENKPLNIDFESLVKLNGTLIFMMSVSTLGQIAEGLINAGMDKDMPAAIIENGTRPEQRKFVSTISDIADVAEQNKVISPAVFAVGKVCGLSERFDWFSKLPLKGVKIAVTRAANNASKLSRKLAELGADITEYPCISIKPIKTDVVLPLENSNSIIFTSANGVEQFFNQLFECNKDIRALYNKKIYCVGSQTAKSLKQYGIIADFVPTVYDGYHLATELIENNIIEPNEKILIVKPVNTSGELTEVFDKNNVKYEQLTVYETEYTDNPDIDIHACDYFTFTSASCVNSFIESAGKRYTKEDFKQIKAVCIGNQTAAAAEQYGMQIFIANEASLDSMAEKLIELSRG